MGRSANVSAGAGGGRHCPGPSMALRAEAGPDPPPKGGATPRRQAHAAGCPPTRSVRGHEARRLAPSMPPCAPSPWFMATRSGFMRLPAPPPRPLRHGPPRQSSGAVPRQRSHPGARGAHRALRRGPHPAAQRARECPPRRPVARGCRANRAAAAVILDRHLMAYPFDLIAHMAALQMDGHLGRFALARARIGAGATALVQGAGELRDLCCRFTPSAWRKRVITAKPKRSHAPPPNSNPLATGRITASRTCWR